MVWEWRQQHTPSTTPLLQFKGKLDYNTVCSGWNPLDGCPAWWCEALLLLLGHALVFTLGVGYSGDLCGHDQGLSECFLNSVHHWQFPCYCLGFKYTSRGRPTCCMLRKWTSRLSWDTCGCSSGFISRRQVNSCISAQAIIVWLRWQNGPWVQQQAGGGSY